MTPRLLPAACAALSALALAGAALAGEPVTAHLQQPVLAKTKIVAGGAMFVCQGDACVAGASDSRTFAVAACKDLARAVGPVTAFTRNSRAFGGGLLDRCNAAAGAERQVARR